MAEQETHNIGKQILAVELFTTGDANQVWIIGGDTIEYLYLIEDIHSFSITGRIRFADRIGLMEFGPLNGSEALRITFGNSGGEKSYTSIFMAIQKVDSVESIRGHQQASDAMVELVLVDMYYHLWHSNIVQKSWTNTSISEIVKDIVETYIKVEFEYFENPTETLEQFDSHNRTPAECVRWLLNRASGAVSGEAGYCLYSYNSPNSDTFTYKAITLEQLLAQTKFMEPHEYVEGDRKDAADAADKGTYYFNHTQPNYVNLIKDFEIQLVDYSSMQTLTGESYLGYDIKRKKLIKRDYTFTDALNKYTILGTKTLFPEHIKIERPINTIECMSDEKFLDNLWYGRWIRDYCEQQLVTIVVTGHEKRHAGGLIRIVWPTSKNYENSDQESQTGEKYNKQMDGKYLVKSVTHYFGEDQQNGWSQTLVCIKNGYKDSANVELLPATKVNVS